MVGGCCLASEATVRDETRALTVVVEHSLPSPLHHKKPHLLLIKAILYCQYNVLVETAAREELRLGHPLPRI